MPTICDTCIHPPTNHGPVGCTVRGDFTDIDGNRTAFCPCANTPNELTVTDQPPHIWLLAIEDHESSRLEDGYAIRPIAAFNTQAEALCALEWVSAYRHDNAARVRPIQLHTIHTTTPRLE